MSLQQILFSVEVVLCTLYAEECYWHVSENLIYKGGALSQALFWTTHQLKF